MRGRSFDGVPFPADFYSVAAQVIAALFILAAVEFRLLFTDDDRDLSVRIALLSMAVGVGLVATFAVGLGAALTSLHHQAVTTHRDIEVIGAMASEVVVVLGMFIANRLLPIADSRITSYEEASVAAKTALAAAREAHTELEHATERNDADGMVAAARRAQDALAQAKSTAAGSTWRMTLPHKGTKLSVRAIPIAAWIVPTYALCALIVNLL